MTGTTFKYVPVTDNVGNSLHSSYSLMPVLSDFDLHLFGEGNNHKIYESLVPHKMTIDGIEGTFFAVWAFAVQKRISVVVILTSGMDTGTHENQSYLGYGSLFIPA